MSWEKLKFQNLSEPTLPMEINIRDNLGYVVSSWLDGKMHGPRFQCDFPEDAGEARFTWYFNGELCDDTIEIESINDLEKVIEIMSNKLSKIGSIKTTFLTKKALIAATNQGYFDHLGETSVFKIVDSFLNDIRWFVCYGSLALDLPVQIVELLAQFIKSLETEILWSLTY